MDTKNLCVSCAERHRQPTQVEVLPEYMCVYCEKSEADILYLGQPSCLKCETKLTITISGRDSIRQSEHGCQVFKISCSNLAVINRKQVKTGSENKMMKKVSDLLPGFVFTKPYLSKLKNVQYYWSKQSGKNLSWVDFLESVERKSPLVFVIQVKQVIFGVFMYQNIQKKKGSVEDKYCGCFQLTAQGLQFSTLEKNRFVVRHQKHIICYGSPGSVHIIFDTMEVQAEYLKDNLTHFIDNFVAIKL